VVHTTGAKIFTVILLVICATGLPAQDASARDSDSPATDREGPNRVSYSADRPAATPLAHVGAWEFSLWSREAIGNSAYGDVGDAYMSVAGFRTGYVFARPVIHDRVRGSVEYFFDIVPVFVLTKPGVVYGGGLSPVGFKWNFLNRRQSYVAFSGGGIFSKRNLPPGNTSSFNFTISADAGLSLWSNARQSLGAGAGFWHLSNATLGGSNPSLNCVQFFVEYHWYKPK